MYAIAAYGAWVVAPIYFKAVKSVPPFEVLAHRVVWSVALLGILMIIRAQWRAALPAIRSSKTMLTLTASTALVGCNWFLFIWAVSNDQILQASLGYYINPLINVLLGLVVLGERLRATQWLSVALAAIGVAWVTFAAGVLPWLSLMLATTFALYGLLRKTARVESLVGISIETALLAPFALGYLVWLGVSGRGAFGAISREMDVLLALAGVVTAVPLLWFTCGARRLPLTTIGFLQYIAPTGQFLLGVFLYNEPFSHSTAVAFAFIWSAVLIFSIDAALAARSQRRRESQQRAMAIVEKRVGSANDAVDQKRAPELSAIRAASDGSIEE